MKPRNLFLIISSIFILLTPCSIKASINTIFKAEIVSQKTTTSAKTIQNKKDVCSLSEFTPTQTFDFNSDFHYFDIPKNFIVFTSLPHSSLIEDENKIVSYSSSKIPYYLLYKQLKFSLLNN